MNLAIRKPLSSVLKTLSLDGYKPISHFSSNSILHHERYLAVCIERVPVITCEKSELEKKYSKVLEEIEFENSAKSNHELWEEKESKKSSNITIDIGKDPTASLKDFEETRIKELENLKTFSKSEEEKFDKIMTSAKRKLSESIYLVTKQKFGSTEAWHPPMDIIGKEETVKSAARRIVQNICGENSKIVFHGNAPFKYEKYKFTNDKGGEKNVDKKKVYYYSVKYISGANIKKDIPYQWLSASELKKSIPDVAYKSMRNSLLLCNEN